MKKQTISALSDKELPLELLVYTKDETFAKTKKLHVEDTIIGICLKDKAWFIGTLPTNAHVPQKLDDMQPEEVLNLAREISGLPLLLPQKQEFADLKSNLTVVHQTFSLVRSFIRAADKRYPLSCRNFTADEETEHEAYYAGKNKSVRLRFIVDLNQLF